MAVRPRYPDLIVAPGVDVVDVHASVLARLEQVAEAIKAKITIISGYRSPAHSVAVGGYANDPHTRGEAVDATVGGVPLSRVRGAQRAIAAAGLESGDRAGFDPHKPGGYDPAHVQLPTRVAPTSGAALSFDQLAQLWVQAGGPAGSNNYIAMMAAAIALAESGGIPTKHNAVPPDDSYGLWQINYYGRLRESRVARFGPPESMFDPLTNARAAVALFNGRKGHFTDWSTYNDGKFEKYLSPHLGRGGDIPVIAFPVGAIGEGEGAGGAAAAGGRARPGGGTGAGFGVGALAGGAVDAAAFFGAALWLLDRGTWLRAVEFVAGAGLLLLALRGMFMLFIEQDTGISFNTLGGAAGVVQRRARRRSDQLIPGSSGRRQRRGERREKERRRRELMKPDPDNPLVDESYR